jgi:outer membrane receptor protein involved in Fe transport
MVSTSPTAFKLAGYGALDLSASLSNSRWTVRLFARNVTNEGAYVGMLPIANALTGSNVQVEGTLIQPRTVGLALDANF